MTQPIISRPLSLSEHFFRSRTSAGFYRGFQVTATYSKDINDLSLLYTALRKTVLDYHILVSNVVKIESPEDYAYQPLDKVVLSDLIEFQDPEAYLTNGTINEKFMNYVNEFRFDFKAAKPLFKLVIVGNRTISSIFEHTIADGVVGNYFHEIFLENLAYAADESNNTELTKEYGVPEFHGLDTVVFEYKDDAKLIKHSLPPPIDDFLPAPAAPLDRATPPEGYEKWPGRLPNTKEYSLAFKHINFDPAQTKLLLTKCKEKGVTLTSYIQTVLLLTIQPIVGQNHYTSNLIAIALRRHIDANLADPAYKPLFDKQLKILGTSAHTGYAELTPPVNEFSWDLAQQISKNLVGHLSKKSALNVFYGFSQVYDKSTDNNEFFEKQMPLPRADTIKLSNLGLIDFPTYKNDWTITDLIFSQDLAPNTADFMLSVVSTKTGGLNFVLTYFSHTFKDTDLDNFDGIIDNLKENTLKYAS